MRLVEWMEECQKRDLWSDFLKRFFAEVFFIWRAFFWRARIKILYLTDSNFRSEI